MTSFEDNSKNQTGRNTNEELSKPYVLFGSSFPKDSEYAQVCRNISKIRLCMESGQMVILLNLENLYESLYDVLNQVGLMFTLLLMMHDYENNNIAHSITWKVGVIDMLTWVSELTG